MRRHERGLEPASFDEADANLAYALDDLEGARNYAAFVVSLIAPYLGDRIIEIGAGHGQVASALRQYGQVSATDISPRCVDLMQARFADDTGVDVFEFDVFEDDPPAAFDSAVLVNVLEHIEDDHAALIHLREVVRPGGAVAVFVPAFELLYGRFDSDVGHHRRYRKRRLSSIMRKSGLEIAELRYVNSPGFISWLVLVRLLGATPTDGRLVRIYDRLVVPLVRLVESRVAPPFGQSVLCVGRRVD